MDEENEKLLIAFVRTVANHCDTCHNRFRSGDDCRDCIALRAKALLAKLAKERRATPQDYSLFSRMQKILAILAASNVALYSYQIDLGGTCSNQLKQWTLKHMADHRMIGRKLDHRKESGYCVYKYFALPRKETRK